VLVRNGWLPPNALRNPEGAVEETAWALCHRGQWPTLEARLEAERACATGGLSPSASKPESSALPSAPEHSCTTAGAISKNRSQDGVSFQPSVRFAFD